MSHYQRSSQNFQSPVSPFDSGHEEAHFYDWFSSNFSTPSVATSQLRGSSNVSQQHTPFTSFPVGSVNNLQPVTVSNHLFSTPQNVSSFNFQSSNNPMPNLSQTPLVPPFQQIQSPTPAPFNPYFDPQLRFNPNFNPYAPAPTHPNRPDLTASQRSRISRMNSHIRVLELDLQRLSRAKVADFTPLPMDIHSHLDYQVWRSEFLMQAQNFCNLHEILDASYVPTHVQYPLAPFNDPIYEDRPELYQVAQELDAALQRQYTTKLNFLAVVLTHCIKANKTAKLLIRPNAINPVQIFAELDRMFIERNPATKGDYITSFFTLTKGGDEQFSVFVTRLDAARYELYTLFNHVIQDDEYLAVLQKGLSRDMMPSYHIMLQSNKSVHEIKQAMIDIEVTTLRKNSDKPVLSAALSNFVSTRYDKQHVRFDSPQKNHYRYRDYDHDQDRPSSSGSYRSKQHHRDRSRSRSPQERRDQRPS